MATESVKPSYYPTPEPGEAELQTTEPAAHEHSDIREFLTLVRRHALLIARRRRSSPPRARSPSPSASRRSTSASTMLLYAPSTTTGTDTDPTRTIATIVGISTSNSVLAPIAARYHLSLRQLKQDVSVGGDSTANLVKIAANSASPASFRRPRERRRGGADQLPRDPPQEPPQRPDHLPAAAAADVRRQDRPERRRGCLRRAHAARRGGAQLASATPDLSVLTPAARPERASRRTRSATRRSACSSDSCSGSCSACCATGSTGARRRSTRSRRSTAPDARHGSVHEAPHAAPRAAGRLLRLRRARGRVPHHPHEPLALPPQQRRALGDRRHLGRSPPRARAPSRPTSRTRSA